MKHIKLIIAVHVVFLALIIAAFLPALKSDDEGYKTKTLVEVPAQQANVMTEKMASENVATELVIDPTPVDATEVAVIQDQPTSVTMMKDNIEEEVVPAKAVVNESTSTTEAAIAAQEMGAPEQQQPIIEPSVTVTPRVKSTSSSVVAGLYSVVDGNKLDASSYAGFKLFRNWCARCHGTYGQGMVGPNLADSLKIISKEQFYDTVENGKSGRIGSMPSWKANVQVMENMDQLYAYLKARSDGAIGVIKPQKQ